MSFGNQCFEKQLAGDADLLPRHSATHVSGLDVLSAAARARIGRATKKRWAKFMALKKNVAASPALRSGQPVSTLLCWRRPYQPVRHLFSGAELLELLN